jgi:hypothetical protein
MADDEAARIARETQEKRRAQIAAWLEAGRLNDNQPTPADPLDINHPTTFLLNTTVARFVRWLQSVTREAERRKFPSGKGYFTVQRAREQDHTGQIATDVPVITIDGLFHEESGGVFLYQRMIYFSVTPLADGRIAAQATCQQPELADYYHQLLKQVEQHWFP